MIYKEKSIRIAVFPVKIPSEKVFAFMRFAWNENAVDGWNKKQYTYLARFFGTRQQENSAERITVL